jgi:hypothetical protein
MKTHYFGLILTLFSCAFFPGCKGVWTGDSRYVLDIPEPPPAWIAMLGDPLWKIEWLNPDGRKGAAVFSVKNPEIGLPQTWASAVSAWPYWPDRGIGPGIFKPAGAIFPFDAVEGRLCLTWQGGVDAVLYWELAATQALSDETDASENVRAAARLPQNFDWPRFRELFEDPDLNEDIRQDPWLADWKTIAVKIVSSGFDKRRFVPEAREDLSLPLNPGPWIGTSPFAAPLIFEDGVVPFFPVREKPDTWVSAEGVLRCSKGAHVFRSGISLSTSAGLH